MNYKSYCFQFLILSVLLVTNACEHSNSLNLVNNGASDYVIVIKTNASDLENHAAAELQKYLEKISSVKLPIIEEENIQLDKPYILVSMAELEKHQIDIKVDGQNLILNGGSETSTLYAVYEFLDQFMGCKWY